MNFMAIFGVCGMYLMTNQNSDKSKKCVCVCVCVCAKSNNYMFTFEKLLYA